MRYRAPLTRLPTHEVENQSPALGDVDLHAGDEPLREALAREAPPWVGAWVARLGPVLGSESARELGFLANENPPRLVAFDRRGQRVDEVRYHPAYHQLMRTAMENEAHSIAWLREGEGGAAAHIAAMYLLTQPEQGYCCPVTMTHAVVPALRHEPALAGVWEPRVLAPAYDERSVPAAEKAGVTFGMAMTEKQGGSDVRTNTTVAEPLAADGEYALTGHKWFCSAPMSDAFLTLARTPAGPTCFLVPRWLEDGTRNPFFIQRLKDKLGNRANASSEVEYAGTWARRVGEEGRGVRTIIEMVQQTRLDAATAPVGMMRWALVQARHHAEHRRAFGARLVEQPLMRNVLADLALEVEAALALVLRVARAFDRAADDASERGFARLATAVVKYYTNKRAAGFVCEAMECLGGGGYVEESVLPRLYREAPLNGIWEGSGNVICLDVLRALTRDPAAATPLLAEIEAAAGGHPALDAALAELRKELCDPEEAEWRARRLTERLALALQASLLLRHAPAEVAETFCATRLGETGLRSYGTLPAGTPVAHLLRRALPA
jgi:putative acyl-CoA dehydrogenase